MRRVSLRGKSIRPVAYLVCLGIVIGCGAGAFVPSEDDGEEAIALLPIFDASNSLVSASVASSSSSIDSGRMQTIGTWNSSIPGTPDLCAAQSGDCLEIATNVYRYPSTGYIQDFYGEDGNQAYLELRPSTDGWGDYQVRLYIYPSTSTATHYVTEFYRVNGDTWALLIDKTTGESNAVAYEDQKTYYFDGRIETRSTAWTRYVDTLAYAPVSIPDSFDDASFTYSNFAEPDKRTPLDQGGGEDYSSASTFSVDSTRTACGKKDKYCISESGTEYYTSVPDSGGTAEVSSKSGSRKTLTFLKGNLKDLTLAADTVRYYTIDADGKKTTKSKTVQAYDLREKIADTVITESIVQSDSDNDGATNYEHEMTALSTDSSVKKVKTYSYNFILSLEETGSSTNTYAGTYTITYTKKNGKTSIKSYDVTVDSDGVHISKKNLTLFTASRSSQVNASTSDSYKTQTSEHFNDAAGANSVSITLDSGILKNAILEGGLLIDGTFDQSDMVIGPGFMFYQDTNVE
jgi:hypothetical protein